MICTMWYAAKLRAGKTGVAFTISPGDILQVWPTDNRCPVLGLELTRGRVRGHMAGNASLDRLLPSAGYTPGNIAVISHRANAIKSDASFEDVRRVADWMAQLGL